jgi:diadenosine tetraphosphate (Ap4A) HIT family hydrolase
MEESKCVFCSTQQTSEVIWEGNFLYAKLDWYPVNPGHFLLIPKRHVINLDELNENEWAELKTGIKQVRC